jgi:SAM-dependent methyltransferase
MAHREQVRFVALLKAHLPEFFQGGRVLEIGSLDINGSIRPLFDAEEYIGVDVGEGPGVDHEREGQLVDFPSGSFDVTISCECMEHNPFWVETVSNMMRMTRPGGLTVVTCASTGREEHGTPRSGARASPLTVGKGWDYYHNVSRREFVRSFRLDRWFDHFLVETNWQSMDLYFVGARRPSRLGTRFATLAREVAASCRPFRSLRGLGIYVAAHVAGPRGVALLRRASRVTGVGRH